jgi:hypothetical protein
MVLVIDVSGYSFAKRLRRDLATGRYGGGGNALGAFGIATYW